MAGLGCDSIDKLKAKLPQLRAELQASLGEGRLGMSCPFLQLLTFWNACWCRVAVLPDSCNEQAASSPRFQLGAACLLASHYPRLNLLPASVPSCRIPPSSGKSTSLHTCLAGAPRLHVLPPSAAQPRVCVCGLWRLLDSALRQHLVASLQTARPRPPHPGLALHPAAPPTGRRARR